MTIDVEATDRSSRPGGDASLAWAALAKFVLGSLGLFYPPSRMNDLRRNFAKASIELGYADEFACMRWIVAPARTQVELRSITQVLARHLTIGETYFLRDRAALDAFESSILPKLIHERRVSGNLRLRLWCAACCTGEEAYTLAVMIHRLLPDIAKWQITITATDLNLNFLQKAREAVYGEWSFRDAPVWLKSNYFKRLDDGRYRVVEEIRRMVDFVQLNLVDAQSISMPGAIRGEILSMDIVFCRNVLMYFDAANVNKAVGLIEKSLVSNGWLAVGPGETASIAHPSFDPVSFPGAVLLRKKSLAHAHAHAHAHTNARARNALEPAQPVGRRSPGCFGTRCSGCCSGRLGAGRRVRASRSGGRVRQANSPIRSARTGQRRAGRMRSLAGGRQAERGCALSARAHFSWSGPIMGRRTSRCSAQRIWTPTTSLRTSVWATRPCADARPSVRSSISPMRIACLRTAQETSRFPEETA